MSMVSNVQKKRFIVVLFIVLEFCVYLYCKCFDKISMLGFFL